MKKLLLYIFVIFLFGCTSKYVSKVPYVWTGKEVTVLKIKEKNDYQTKKMTKKMYLYLQEVNCECKRYIVNLGDDATGITLHSMDIFYLNEKQERNVYKVFYNDEDVEKYKEKIKYKLDSL